MTLPMNDGQHVEGKLPISKATRARNPQLFPPTPGTRVTVANQCLFINKTGVVKRLRQSAKPLLNKLETEYHLWLSGRIRCELIKSQSVTLKLANGVKYTPDFFAFHGGRAEAFEVKGSHSWDDAIVKLKVAAHEWPEIQFILVYKRDGQWIEERVLP